jgi:hypothetical protein
VPRRKLAIKLLEHINPSQVKKPTSMLIPLEYSRRIHFPNIGRERQL